LAGNQVSSSGINGRRGQQRLRLDYIEDLVSRNGRSAAGLVPMKGLLNA
jgi:hypothetical protein